MSSAKKIAANRVNGQKSNGPMNTTSTRFNAIKHGLLSVGVTELDDAEKYRTRLRDLIEEHKPVGTMEKFYVESAALEIVRLLRARQLEAEYITSRLNPPQRGPNLFGDDEIFRGTVLDPGLPARIDSESAYPLVSLYQRYETNILLRLQRLLNSLERLQRMRRGEQVAAPSAVDVSVHAEAVQRNPSAKYSTPVGSLPGEGTTTSTGGETVSVAGCEVAAVAPDEVAAAESDEAAEGDEAAGGDEAAAASSDEAADVSGDEDESAT